MLGSSIQKAKISLRNSSIAKASGVDLGAGVATDEVVDSVVSKFEDETVAKRIEKTKRKEMGWKDFISVINGRTGVDARTPLENPFKIVTFSMNKFHFIAKSFLYPIHFLSF